MWWLFTFIFNACGWWWITFQLAVVKDWCCLRTQNTKKYTFNISHSSTSQIKTQILPNIICNSSLILKNAVTWNFNLTIRCRIVDFRLCYTIVTRNGKSENTGCLNRNLYAMLKFTEWPKTPGMTSKKALLSLKGISRFCANLDETKADMVQFTKRWN